MPIGVASCRSSPTELNVIPAQLPDFPVCARNLLFLLQLPNHYVSSLIPWALCAVTSTKSIARGSAVRIPGLHCKPIFGSLGSALRLQRRSIVAIFPLLVVSGGLISFHP